MLNVQETIVDKNQEHALETTSPSISFSLGKLPGTLYSTRPA
jgi:hypothetical protein